MAAKLITLAFFGAALLQVVTSEKWSRVSTEATDDAPTADTDNSNPNYRPFASHRTIGKLYDTTNDHFAAEAYMMVRNYNLKNYAGLSAISHVASAGLLRSMMALMYLASNGQTSTEIANLFHFEGFTRGELWMAHKFQISKITKNEGVRAKTITRIYLQEGHPFNKAFCARMETFFNGHLRLIDFTRDGARGEINKDIEEEIGKKDFIPPGIITPLTQFIGFEGIDFEAEWLVQFKPAELGTFHLSSKKSVKIPMMSLTESTGKFQFADKGTYVVIEVPYTNNKLKFYAIAPKSHDGLAQLEETLLTKSDWFNIINEGLEKVEFNLFQMPKFSLSYSVNVKDLLQDNGVQKLFVENGADLSRLTPDRNAYVGAIFQATTFEVDETRTKATSGIVSEISSRAVDFNMVSYRKVELKLDGPFIFAVNDYGSGFNLFMGRFCGPKSDSATGGTNTKERGIEEILNDVRHEIDDIERYVKAKL